MNNYQSSYGNISLYRWNESVFPERNRLDKSFKGSIIYGGPTNFTRLNPPRFVE